MLLRQSINLVYGCKLESLPFLWRASRSRPQSSQESLALRLAPTERVECRKPLRMGKYRQAIFPHEAAQTDVVAPGDFDGQ